MATSSPSLADAIAAAGSSVDFLRNAQARPTVFPVAPEFSNWRSEQHSWRETVALLDQSHHMTDLFLTGPDALKLLSDTGVNSFAKFQVDNAKQFIAVNHEGYLIGDAILFYLAEESFDLVGHPMVIDWVQYHLETGDYDAQVERDGNSIVRQGPPKLYRYELQGPNALALVEKLIGGPVPATKFFHMTSFQIAGSTVRALRHGMAGQPGFELFGPWAEGDSIRAALIEAGADLGLVQVGSMGYSSANLESGWVPSPLPAIFSGEGTDAYRAWLGAAGAGSLAGSLLSSDIEDYYVTPYDLGYGRSVAFDHDFIGRAALERHAENQTRTKVTLVWNGDDVAAAIGSLFQPGTPAKYMALPKSRYGLYQADEVLLDGKPVGISMDCGYMANEQVFASLATIDSSAAETGTEVTVTWGEDPNTRKPQVEPHRQVTIRATVAPAPYLDYARSNYRDR
ncbi:aminomethyltransferase family protein [Naasia lichenicola]|uniref:Aminomethyl transferase family protein n=1 Tax=Naasia lichenicola TaxID=2565933 RepID=A0A4V3WSY5_9MICO|nr:aminomethyltransferase family protein [Naasia lichenicola]THG29927.1 aminomethyl transferase family protein [Naasia lichenicola]